MNRDELIVMPERISAQAAVSAAGQLIHCALQLRVATARLHLGYTHATLSLHLGYTYITLRLPLGYTKALFPGETSSSDVAPPFSSDHA